LLSSLVLSVKLSNSTARITFAEQILLFSFINEFRIVTLLAQHVIVNEFVKSLEKRRVIV